MLSNKKKGTSASNGQALNTIIGRGSRFEGKLTVDNSVRIDGVFKGELVCTGELTISQSGEADATLQCKDAYIDGVVSGSVRADKVRLDTQSRFTGDVYTDSFTVSEGAIFSRFLFDGKSPEEERVVGNGCPRRRSGQARPAWAWTPSPKERVASNGCPKW